jgi:rubrerythrin
MVMHQVRKTRLKGIQSQKSILVIHQEKLEEFSKTEENTENVLVKIRKLEAQSKKLVKSIQLCTINKIFGKEIDDLRLKFDQVGSEIEKLKKTYTDLTTHRSETDYLLSSHLLLSEYLELEKKEAEVKSEDSQEIENIFYEINKRKREITESYMQVIDPTYFKMTRNISRDQIFCQDCNITLEIHSGYGVCPDCGKCIRTLHLADQPGFKEIQDLYIRPQFSYDKMTHLEEWLRRFQAKEHKEIPQNILDVVLLEAHKERVTDLNTLTEKQVKRYLKKLELNDYYDNIISIINRLNNRPRFVLTPEVEGKIKEMFKMVQEPFDRYKPKGRKNMLSYSYILNKFFRILKLDEFSKYFFLLKSPEKLRQQDETFKKIVEELAVKDPYTGWKFFPS